MINIFRQPSAQDLRKRQLAEAERLALEHTLNAEHHDSLAKMYGTRVARLKKEVAASAA